MMFCNMHCIVLSYNLSNGSKSTYTGINAQNLNGLSEKVTGLVSLSVSVVKTLNSSIVDLFWTHAAVTHSSWQFLMLSRASRMTMSQCIAMLDKCQKLTWKEQIITASCSIHAECSLDGHKPNAIPVANDTRWDSGYDYMKGVLYHQPLFDFMDIVFTFKLNWQ